MIDNDVKDQILSFNLLISHMNTRLFLDQFVFESLSRIVQNWYTKTIILVRNADHLIEIVSKRKIEDSGFKCTADNKGPLENAFCISDAVCNLCDIFTASLLLINYSVNHLNLLFSSI